LDIIQNLLGGMEKKTQDGKDDQNQRNKTDQKIKGQAGGHKKDVVLVQFLNPSPRFSG
jgi:hypothetical protein